MGSPIGLSILMFTTFWLLGWAGRQGGERFSATHHLKHLLYKPEWGIYPVVVNCPVLLGQGVDPVGKWVPVPEYRLLYVFNWEFSIFAKRSIVCGPHRVFIMWNRPGWSFNLYQGLTRDNISACMFITPLRCFAVTQQTKGVESMLV